MRKLQWMLASLALPVLAGWSTAGELAPLRLNESATEIRKPNQQLADELAQMYRSSAQLNNYRVNIETEGGVVTLTGRAADEAQRLQILAMTRRHPGVVAVNDKIETAGAPLMAANFQAPKPLPTQPASEANQHGDLAEPAPINAFIGGVAPYSDAPVLPPYAWPAYTPYNNYASLAYQTQYPSGAWPFIGPPYPYPMIPSGWRRVTLKWHHGYWWLKFHAH